MNHRANEQRGSEHREDDRIVYAIGMLDGVEKAIARLTSMVVWSFVFLAILIVSSCVYGMAS